MRGRAQLLWKSGLEKDKDAVDLERTFVEHGDQKEQAELDFCMD
jgi:hypothetical protein